MVLLLALFGCGGDGGSEERPGRQQTTGEAKQGTTPAPGRSAKPGLPGEPPSEKEIRRREDSGQKPVDDRRLERQIADALRAAYDRPQSGGFTLDLVTFIGARSGDVLVKADPPENEDLRGTAKDLCAAVRNPPSPLQGLRSLAVEVGTYRTRC